MDSELSPKKAPRSPRLVWEEVKLEINRQREERRGQDRTGDGETQILEWSSLSLQQNQPG